jgi:hypothetical protein
VPNKGEVKSDIGLPAYCEPPNPCPNGYKHKDCDPRPYGEFTAEFSKNYQNRQKCMCDSDHNVCSNPLKDQSSDNMIDGMDMTGFLPVVAKKSPRVKRVSRNK